MFSLSTKKLETAMFSARQLKSTAALLYAGKHGVLFGTRSEAGTFLTLLTKEKQPEAAIQVEIEDLAKAIYQVKDIDVEIKPEMLRIKSKKVRSAIQLASQVVKDETANLVLQMWDDRSNGNNAPMLARMLAENKTLFSIKDHVGGKPVPVHIRWSRDGVAAGMSDMFHGVSIRTQEAPKKGDKARELFVYSSWLPLLIDYLAPPEPKENDKTQVKLEVAKLHMTETHISVSNNNSLLQLQAIVPGADAITLDDVAKIAGNVKAKDGIKLSMADCHAALRRSTAVVPTNSAVRIMVDPSKPERLRIEGRHDSGSKILEEVKTSRASTAMSFSCTLYNLLDITAASIPACRLTLAGKAVLFSYDYGSKSDTVYRVDLFSATT